MNTEQSAEFTLVSFDGTRVAFPLRQVVGLQNVKDVARDRPLPLAVGSVELADRRWPVFHLDSGFLPREELPQKHGQCVCLSADGGDSGVAIICDSARAISLDEDASLEPIPVCAQRPSSPMRHWLNHEQQLLMVSDAPALAEYLWGFIEQVQADA